MRAGLLVLSGYNIRAVVALCRWARAARFPVHLAARNADDPIGLTDYASWVFVERASPALDAAEVADWIKGLRAAHDYDAVVIAPSTEYFNRFVLRHRTSLEAAGAVVPLVDERLYARVSDKEAFTALCASHGIPVPASFDQTPGAPPFVAKPRFYGAATSGQVKPYLVRTAEERARFLQREDPAGYFFQEYVGGQSLYLLAHVSRDGAVTTCAQENLIQQADGGSIVLARSHEFDAEADAHAYFRMLRAVGFHGLIMIEVRRCRETGRTVMIEANPRMWGPMQFTIDRGVDLFAPLLADHGIAAAAPAIEPHTGMKRLTHYFWSGGLVQGGQSVAFHDYSAAQFANDHAMVASADLFARDDTRRLHAHELARDIGHELPLELTHA